MPTVRGTLSLPPGTPDSASTVTIQVENVTRADAPALIAGEQVLHDVSLRDLHFEILVTTVDPHARYTIRARAEITGGGTLLTTQSVPVLTRGAPTEVTVPITRV